MTSFVAVFRMRTQVSLVLGYKHYNAHDEHVTGKTVVAAGFTGERGIVSCSGTLRGNE